MNNQDFTKLAEKYLRGECLPDEELLFQKYLDSFQHTSTNWNAFDLGDKQNMEDKIYSEIKKKIENTDRNLFQKILFTPHLIKTAASIILFITLSTTLLIVSGIFNKKPKAVIWNENVTEMGQKFTLSLPDGSTIILNADSKLKYPIGFGKNSREVYLKGEAYFNISHNPSKPFVVHTGNLVTTVLGTKFNISAFPEEKNIAVSLVSGSVKVSKENSGTVENIVMLQPDQQLLYNKNNEIGTVEHFDLQEATGWKENVLVFKKEPFKNVLVKLERAYGIKFELTDPSFSNRKITANFKNESLWTISETLKKLTGLQCKNIKEKNETKKIIFYKK
ncbi:MAG: FecR domain-containing protein [Ignavibacteriales bacterium]|nr:FecR domain-containing protein [Ignavibacteriales bacterium]